MPATMTGTCLDGAELPALFELVPLGEESSPSKRDSIKSGPVVYYDYAATADQGLLADGDGCLVAGLCAAGDKGDPERSNVALGGRRVGTAFAEGMRRIPMCRSLRISFNLRRQR